MVADGYPAQVYMIVAFFGIIEAQLSVVCIWAATRLSKSIWSCSAPFVAAGAAAVVSGTVSTSTDFTSELANYLTYFSLHTILLLASLWLLQRTRWWQRRTGISHELRYSIFQLLITMTVVAVLAAAMRNSSIFGVDGWANIAYVASSVAIAVASAIIWISPWHWALRLAAVLGCASVLSPVLAIAINLSSSGSIASIVSLIIGAHYAIQAVVISIWLAWGGILPWPSSGDAEVGANRLHP
jgi:hypothetical protein